MQKVISLFQRNYDGDRLIRDEVVPGAEWVLAGEGVPTRKWDGMPALIRAGRLYKRYDAKHGKTPPPDFEPVQPEPDPESGHWPGWRPVDVEAAEDRAFAEAFQVVYLRGEVVDQDMDDRANRRLVDGTYELLGPKVNGNPELIGRHVLFRHGAWPLPDIRRDYQSIKSFLATAGIEGIVWHHPDGRMVKIKARDFGITRVRPVLVR